MCPGRPCRGPRGQLVGRCPSPSGRSAARAPPARRRRRSTCAAPASPSRTAVAPAPVNAASSAVVQPALRTDDQDEVARRRQRYRGQRHVRRLVQHQRPGRRRRSARRPPGWSAGSATAGTQARRDCLAAARAVDRQRSSDRCAARTLPAGHRPGRRPRHAPRRPRARPPARPPARRGRPWPAPAPARTAGPAASSRRTAGHGQPQPAVGRPGHHAVGDPAGAVGEHQRPHPAAAGVPSAAWWPSAPSSTVDAPPGSASTRKTGGVLTAR